MSKKIILTVIVAAIILDLGYLALNKFSNTDKSSVIDPQNTTYTIEGESVTLVNGKSEKDIPDSTSKIRTQYFGNKVEGDFNNDGMGDVAFLLSQNSGGSGTFYYVVAILGSKSGSVSTNTIYIGDRIAPQTSEFRNGEIIINYADRRIDEPMVATPSVGVSRYFKIDNNSLVEIQK